MLNLFYKIWFLSFAVLILAIFALHPSQKASAQTSQQEQSDTPEEQTSPQVFPPNFEIPKKLQTELPQEAPVATRKSGKLPNWLKAFAVITKYIFYGFLILCVSFLVYMLVREIIRIRRNRAPQGEKEEAPPIPVYQPDAETARIVLDDADKLASEGRFTEAVHTLLFRSIQDIEDKRPHHVNTSLTSREISKLPILSRKARDGFSMISTLVESSFFGGNTLTANDYSLSKSAYKTFAFEKIET